MSSAQPIWCARPRTLCRTVVPRPSMPAPHRGRKSSSSPGGYKLAHRAPPDMNVAEWAAWLGSVDNVAPVYAQTRIAKFLEVPKADLAGWLLANHAVNLLPDFPAQLKFRLKLR